MLSRRRRHLVAPVRVTRRFAFTVPRLALLVAPVALVAATPLAPVSAGEFSIVEQAECTGMRIRLEPEIRHDVATGVDQPVPHHYRFRLVDGDDCTRTFVKAVAGVREAAHAKIRSHDLRDGLEGACEGAGCWPRLCSGALDGSFGVDVTSDSGRGTSTFEVGEGAEPRGVGVFQANPGGAAPSRLTIRGFDDEVGVVALAGEFSRVGSCDETGAAFEGSMVFYDPVPPEPDDLAGLTGA